MSRLTFLEESIFWTDSVNRKDLISRFGISEQQASGDLTRYQEIAPDNLVYDKSDKTIARLRALRRASCTRTQTRC